MKKATLFGCLFLLVVGFVVAAGCGSSMVGTYDGWYINDNGQVSLELVLDDNGNYTLGMYTLNMSSVLGEGDDPPNVSGTYDVQKGYVLLNPPSGKKGEPLRYKIKGVNLLDPDNVLLRKKVAVP